MSEPQSSGALAVEMAGLDVIPESDRKGKPSDLFMPWFAANISVLGISWGSWVLGFGLSLAQAIVVSLVGVTLSFLVCGFIAIAASAVPRRPSCCRARPSASTATACLRRSRGS